MFIPILHHQISPCLKTAGLGLNASVIFKQHHSTKYMM